ncbi:hypothetical protein NLK61_13380 [Pseudomonas fuscovaginae UPB0736]|uniref:Uncharacterized protein n=1 Tax=Pseudomonas asplenii TaxID=53407 RepID=A0A1H1RY29_9PSED|nr:MULTISPECIES: hypothetical protein [Pseudomonas]UUQ67576.1 hypothetical protein NLK61_13380 [Pseudomonas fuscovaginae UPB0736]UZE29155.1 hypothetical protein LOY63_28335 [Pseudomonas asplenii]SDS40651.1 hypothetical protein SAMN05216598_1492 [Pseudomonas asplenii]
MNYSGLLCTALLLSLTGCEQSAPSSSLVSETATDAHTLKGGFRATGNEPGWVVEVGAGETPPVHLEMNYGQQKTAVAKTESTPDGFFGNAADGTEIQVLIDRSTCTDDMSGKQFEATVLLKVGDRDYHGCGGWSVGR